MNTMHLLTLLIVALPFCTLAQSDPSIPQAPPDSSRREYEGLEPVQVVVGSRNVDSNSAVTFAEQMPEFPGGQQALMEFLRQNVRYPEMERDNDVQGTVYVGFVVDKTGKVRDAQLLRGVPKGPGLDSEALRVVRMMPDWKPGMQSGKAVHVQFTLPVKFTLK